MFFMYAYLVTLENKNQNDKSKIEVEPNCNILLSLYLCVNLYDANYDIKPSGKKEKIH